MAGHEQYFCSTCEEWDSMCICGKFAKTASEVRRVLGFTELNPPETARTYWFPGGYSVVLKNVRRISVSNSGIHRLETGDGKKHIVPQGWKHIELQVSSWTM